jgi:predicted transcriptional regulator
MVGRTVPRVALLAIHPGHASAILEGRKTVEFRKRRLAPEVQYVLLYATSPMRKVVGCFRIARLDEGSPTSIWQRHGDQGAIPRRLFRAYYCGAKTAVAIIVERAIAFDEPLLLVDLQEVPTPPQSFAYVSGHTVAAVCQRGNPAVRSNNGLLDRAYGGRVAFL